MVWYTLTIGQILWQSYFNYIGVYTPLYCVLNVAWYFQAYYSSNLYYDSNYTELHSVLQFEMFWRPKHYVSNVHIQVASGEISTPVRRVPSLELFKSGSYYYVDQIVMYQCPLLDVCSIHASVTPLFRITRDDACKPPPLAGLPGGSDSIVIIKAGYKTRHEKSRRIPSPPSVLLSWRKVACIGIAATSVSHLFSVWVFSK